MNEPRPSRPYMPGYGIVPAEEGSGLIPWAAAEEKLATSKNYWVSTITPVGVPGRPHLMPVWALWLDSAVWFSSALRSRKVRNIAVNPQCTVATEDSDNPVIVSGTAEIVVGRDETLAFLAAMNDKYNASYGADFVDPSVNATIRIRPEWAFSLLEGDFTGSPTRWDF